MESNPGDAIQKHKEHGWDFFKGVGLVLGRCSSVSMCVWNEVKEQEKQREDNGRCQRR